MSDVILSLNTSGHGDDKMVSGMIRPLQQRLIFGWGRCNLKTDLGDNAN